MTASTAAFPPPADNAASAVRPPCWHDDFLTMLPKIQRHAQIVFRGLRGDTREEAVQEAVCRACAAYADLVEQGRADAATWSSLARFAVARVRDGRQIGAVRNVNDVSSWYCQRQQGVSIRNLYEWDNEEQEWREIVVEDRKATPAEIAATRIDFADWLATLSQRDRRIAEKLATSESTSRVAQLFGISPGRISQLRQELKAAWEQFHELPERQAELAAA